MIRKRMLSILFTFNLLIAFQQMHAQSKPFFNPGFFLNGTESTEDVFGMGLIAGLEYIPAENHWFSIEVRTKYGYYAFNDGTTWTTDKDGSLVVPLQRSEARLAYKLFSPQVGLVPKLHLRFDEPWSLFLENEFVTGLMAGEFTYKGFEREKKFTEPVYCYNIGIGAESAYNGWILSASLTCSTLNFRRKIREHRPRGYQEWIPNQNAFFLLNVLFKIPLISW